MKNYLSENKSKSGNKKFKSIVLVIALIFSFILLGGCLSDEGYTTSETSTETTEQDDIFTAEENITEEDLTEPVTEQSKEAETTEKETTTEKKTTTQKETTTKKETTQKQTTAKKETTTEKATTKKAVTTEKQTTKKQTTTKKQSSNANESNADYILNKNSEVIHYPDCKSVKKMKEENKIYFKGSRDEIPSNYRPCGNCHP